MQQCDVIGKHTHYYKSYMVVTVGSASFPLQVTITPPKHSHEMGQVDSVESESKRGKERTGSYMYSFVPCMHGLYLRTDPLQNITH